MSTSDRGVGRLIRGSAALVLAGGRGARLLDLTERRAKPAVYFGAKYRIIDFALSNCLNSGMRRIYVLTQYKSHSLVRHIQRGWGFLRGEMNEFIDLLPAQQRVSEDFWYRGTADAVWQNLDILRAEGPSHIVILAGDHVYKMDYGVMIQDHVDTGADATIACIEVPRKEASAFGVMKTNAEGRILGFLEKPADPPETGNRPGFALASMGIYVFNAEFLYEALSRDSRDPKSTHDFGRDFIPDVIGKARVMTHTFGRSCVYGRNHEETYWRDVGTVDAYYAANLDLCAVSPALDLYDPNWPIYTYQVPLAPAKFVFDSDDRRGAAMDSVVADGSIVSGATVRRSLLFPEVRANSWATIDESVILPNCNIGRHARLRRVILDRGCEIPENLAIGYDAEKDARRFYRTENGVTLVTPKMLEAPA